MRLTRKEYLLFLLFVCLFEISVALIGNIGTRPGWGDEVRFHQTIINFANNFSLDLLKTYHQMSTPLPFALYALWGKIFGLTLFPLRILSILIALVTYSLFFHLLGQFTDNKKLLWFTSLFLVVHPYNVGLSIFVFTDMIAILFILSGFRTVIKNRPMLFTLFSALAILSRQYMIFFVAAVGLYFLLKFFLKNDKQSLIFIWGAVISLLPFIGLMMLWNGASPNNDLKQLYLTDGYSYDPHKLFLYLIILFVYALPLVAHRWKMIYTNWKILSYSIIAGLLYFLFPVTPSESSLSISVHTVGYFHKALERLTGDNTVVQILFYLCFTLSLPILYLILRQVYFYLKSKRFTADLLLIICILLFMVVMPFSYLSWEKYFMPLLPFVLLYLVQLKERGLNRQSD